ncbi:MAG TPA: aspartate ammonia-lyase, partial [Burkholderiaceae bacterium]|nr:aspartate ammonia-lyase [Burkholderiaceae bacterium]
METVAKHNSTEVRIEQDSLGECAVPAAAYYGIHTVRAVENYPITGTPIGAITDLIRAYALVKKAATLANRDLDLLPARKAEAIIQACDEIAAGALHDQFVVDVIQGGAGTSTNMNVNEVVANRALEILGHPRGAYAVLHPLDDVNASQSTNDTYPTAIKVGLCFAVQRLLAAMAVLRKSFEKKAFEFRDVLKIGRTQLQDAVPMTLGQEFSTYAIMLGEDEQRLQEAMLLITEINLGATAIGTGINTDPDYAQLACRYLAELSGLPLKPAANFVEATQDTGSFMQVSGVLKRVACKLSKTCNDLRLLSSGPQAGLAEIFLPPRAAGSSIMPGKVNPVIPEVVNQVAFEVVGNDMTVTMASEAGQLQLNAFEPVIGFALFKSITHL